MKNQNQKNKWVALGLSTLFPGVGQMYNGEVTKGASFLFGWIVSWMFAWTGIGLLFVFLFQAGAMADAYQVAVKGGGKYA